jgi:asparagine synthase (glutamine-hydrolysing)
LRKVLYEYVPREYLDRPKHGFGVPMRQWLSDLRALVDQHVEPSLIAAQGLFDGEAVRRLLACFRAGDRLAEQKLWLLLAFQMWHARWMSN